MARLYLLSSLLFSLLFLSPISSASAHEVRYLAEPEQALAAYIKLVQQANKSIDIATFIFEPCDSSVRLLLELLAKKSREGVRVRILLDDLQQSSGQKKFLANMAAKYGFEFRFYNTVEKNLRLHIKLLVVDGVTYLTGGRNLSDKYFALSAEKNYIDRDVLVTGPSAARAASSFQELWQARSTAKKVGQSSQATSVSKFCGYDDSARVSSIKSFLERKGDLILEGAPPRVCERVTFVTDNPNFADITFGGANDRWAPDPYLNPMRLKEKRSSNYMVSYLNGAKLSLRGENWVYMPINLISDALALARAKHVRIRFITNSDTEDGPQVFREAMDYAIRVFSDRHSVGTQRVKRISAYGGMNAAHELTPKGTHFFLHGKVFLRDGQDIVVSSFNLDPRSYNQNLESVAAVRGCPELVNDAETALTKLFEMHEEDEQTGRVPSKKEPSLLAKILARTAFALF